MHSTLLVTFLGIASTNAVICLVEGSDEYANEDGCKYCTVEYDGSNPTCWSSSEVEDIADASFNELGFLKMDGQAFYANYVSAKGAQSVYGAQAVEMTETEWDAYVAAFLYTEDLLVCNVDACNQDLYDLIFVTPIEYDESKLTTNFSYENAMSGAAQLIGSTAALALALAIYT